MYIMKPCVEDYYKVFHIWAFVTEGLRASLGEGMGWGPVIFICGVIFAEISFRPHRGMGNRKVGGWVISWLRSRWTKSLGQNVGVGVDDTTSKS